MTWWHVTYQPARVGPYACPCCNGTGLRNIPPGVAGTQESSVTFSGGPWECAPCKGTGLVWAETVLPPMGIEP